MEQTGISQEQRDTLRRIKTISDLKMVKVYHLFGGDGSVMGVLAYYGDSVINLCNADACFAELFDRIAEVYAREAEEKEIIADEETLRFLKDACVFPTDEFQKCLADYEEQDAPSFLPKAFSYLYVLPIVKFIMEGIYRQKEEKIQFESRTGQWFGRGILEAVMEEQLRRFPFVILETVEGSYEVTVQNVLKPGNPLKVLIRFGDYGMAATYEDRFFLIRGSLLLRMDQERAVVSHSMREGERTLEEWEENCEEAAGMLPTREVRRLTMEKGDWRALCLPWGDKLFLAGEGRERLRVYASEGDGVTVSHVSHYQIPEEWGEQARFCLSALRLYEREDAAELHLLEPGAPGSSIWREKYSGRYFGRNRHEQRASTEGAI